jgi:hypothetical protein
MKLLDAIGMLLEGNGLGLVSYSFTTVYDITSAHDVSSRVKQSVPT